NPTENRSDDRPRPADDSHRWIEPLRRRPSPWPTESITSKRRPPLHQYWLPSETLHDLQRTANRLRRPRGLCRLEDDDGPAPLGVSVQQQRGRSVRADLRRDSVAI